jgi:glycosyltransferase involved in cell wall biosynthesis
LPTGAKRICFLLNNSFTNDGRVQREADALVAAGHSVTVIAVAPRTLGDRHIPLREKQGNLHILRILPKPLYRFHSFSLRTLKGFLNITRQCRGFDVIHCHDAPMLWLGFLLSKWWRAKLIYDSHEYWEALYSEEEAVLSHLLDDGKLPEGDTRFKRFQPRKIKQALANIGHLREFEAWLMPRADAVITVNDSIGDLLQQKAGFLRQRVIVRNICKRPAIFEQMSLPQLQKQKRFHQEFQLPSSTFIILYQGMIAKKRGIQPLVDAIALLGQQFPSLQVALVLMGPVKGAEDQGFLDQLSHTIAQTPALHRKVFYHPAVPNEELLEWTASADLGVHPILPKNLNHHFCLPNKVFEYIHAGIPMAVSHFPEMKALVEHYQIGETFDPEAPASICQAIGTLLQDRERYQTYKSNLARAQQELTWEQESTKLTGLYQKLS